VFCVDIRTDVPTARMRRSGMPQFDVSVDTVRCVWTTCVPVINLVFFIYLYNRLVCHVVHRRAGDAVISRHSSRSNARGGGEYYILFDTKSVSCTPHQALVYLGDQIKEVTWAFHVARIGNTLNA
jgi:hypothetical protein